MEQNIANIPITLKPVELKADEVHCTTCGGVGFVYEDEKETLQYCSDCFAGRRKVCPTCGATYRSGYVCDNKRCEILKIEQREARNYTKAKKYTDINAVPADKREMLYSAMYPYNEGYFNDIAELQAYCTEVGVQMPKYVWCTDYFQLSMDAYDLVANACDDLWEGAYDNVVDIPELQVFLNKWCAKQTGTKTYVQDVSSVLLL